MSAFDLRRRRIGVAVMPGQTGLSNADPIGEQLLAVINRSAATLVLRGN
jgi:hypothetical protein